MAREIPPFMARAILNFHFLTLPLRADLQFVKKFTRPIFRAIEFASINATLLKSHSRFTVEGPKRSPVLALWLLYLNLSIWLKDKEEKWGLPHVLLRF